MSEPRSAPSGDLLLEPLESLLNRAIATSTPAQDRCRTLAGKTIAFTLDGLSLTFFWHVSGDGIRLSWNSDDEPALSLAGTPGAFLAMTGSDAQGVIRGGRVSIDGDMDVARSFEELLRHARPDWEEELSRLVGDLPARQIGNVVRALTNWGRKTVDTVLRNTGEYLSEESQAAPSTAEADAFMREVDALRDRAERAAARVAHLEARLRGDMP